MWRIIFTLCALTVVALLVTAANAATPETANEPWFVKKQDLSKEQYLAAIASDDGRILRVKARDLARELNNVLGLPAPESPEALAAFLGSMTVGACTTALLREVSMGRTNKSGTAFDYTFSRTKCGKGEMWLFYQGVPVLSLWCGNLIIAPQPKTPPPVKAADNCYYIYLEARRGKTLLSKEVALVVDVWTKSPDKRFKGVVYDPCFRVWNADKTVSWTPPRLCEECQSDDQTAKAPQKRHRRKSDDIFEVLLRGGAGYLSLPKWYIDVSGSYAAELLFCSPKESFRHPNTSAHNGMWWWWEHTRQFATSNGNPTNDPVSFTK